MEERHCVCRVCGKAFTRDHDRKTHEQLHAGEKNWFCGGTLKNGEHWGCGWRFARKSNLQRHFRSELGGRCIKPLRDEENLERNKTTELKDTAIRQDPTHILDLNEPQPQPVNVKYSATTALTEITRTENNGAFPGAPPVRTNISPVATSNSIHIFSTKPDRHNMIIGVLTGACLELTILFPETLQGRENGSDTLMTSFENPAKINSEEGLLIPVEHTAAAHKLLMWPSIKQLLSYEYDEDYVMRLEEGRGLISIYGQGEISTADDTQQPTNPLTSDNGGFNEKKTNADGRSKLQSAESSSDVDAEIDQFGLLKLDARTARKYHRSYLDHMHKLHPFLNQSELEMKVNAYIRCYCPENQPSTMEPDSQCPKKGCANSHDELNRPQSSVKTSSASPRPRVGRNIGIAIIILVFALGAICECSYPLPGLIMEEKANFEQEEIPRTFGPSKAKTTNDKHSSCDEFGYVKNLQAVPGLALYGFTTTILGNHQGGVELEHVQAGLLAGLYASQLAHPFQSHGWICQAARACQVLLRQKRYERLEEGAQKDLHKFAYWTCLQLESDLLAELDLPASGISRSEGRIGLPTGRYTIAIPDNPAAPSIMMMLFYSAQIHLCNALKPVYTDLYKVEKHGQIHWSPYVQATHSMNLDLWRFSLPEIMKWEDTDPPTSDINATRMRAKYYAAQYIIHRPVLYDVLHYGQAGPHVGVVGQSQTLVDSPTGSTPRSPSSSFLQGWTPPTVNLHNLPSKVRRACKVCVDSLILSTEAFQRIDGRLVVPNIFGTAHAYVLLIHCYLQSFSLDLISYSSSFLGNLETCSSSPQSILPAFPSSSYGASSSVSSDSLFASSCVTRILHPHCVPTPASWARSTRRSLDQPPFSTMTHRSLYQLLRNRPCCTDESFVPPPHAFISWDSEIVNKTTETLFQQSRIRSLSAGR
jgi:hypothetical protein